MLLNLLLWASKRLDISDSLTGSIPRVNREVDLHGRMWKIRRMRSKRTRTKLGGKGMRVQVVDTVQGEYKAIHLDIQTIITYTVCCLEELKASFGCIAN